MSSSSSVKPPSAAVAKSSAGSSSSSKSMATPPKRLTRRTSAVTSVHDDEEHRSTPLGAATSPGRGPLPAPSMPPGFMLAAPPAAAEKRAAMRPPQWAVMVAMVLLVSAGALLNTTSSSLGPAGSSSMLLRHTLHCGSSACRVRFTSQQDDQVVHEAELVPEHRSLFADDMIIEEEHGGQRTINRKTDVQHVMYHTKPGTEQWGAAIVDPSTNTLVSGLFLTKHGNRVIEHNVRANRHLQQEPQEDAHEVVEMPGVGQPWLVKQKMMMKAAAEDTTVLVTAAKSAVVTPFFPKCFQGDTVTQVFRMDVVYDYGLASSFSSTAAALADLDVLFSAGKLVFLSQLNVRLELGKVTLGTASSPVPLSRGGGGAKGTKCVNALGALPEIIAWSKTQPRTGFTLLMSDCFSGVTGTSYIGSACSTSYNANVAAHSWLIAFHELGHAFGMSHSFENGVGTTGGLMDYGNGLYKGVAQFHPNKRDEVCPFLDYTVPVCPFFTASDVNSACGDGILSKGETCECVQQGKKSCGNCKNCQATASVECSSKDFVFRTASMPATVIVANVEYMADQECCTSSNKLAPAKTLCGANKLDACTVGKCKPVCSEHLSYMNPNCGFDDSGCMLGCVHSSKCTFSLSFAGQEDGKPVFVSSVGDGTRCIMPSTGEPGTCANRVCSASSAGGLPAQESAVEEKKATARPTRWPTAAPSVCAKKKKNPCVKLKTCKWAKSSCQPRVVKAKLTNTSKRDGGGEDDSSPLPTSAEDQEEDQEEEPQDDGSEELEEEGEY